MSAPSVMQAFSVRRWFSWIDWPLFVSALTIALLGLATMRPFADDPQGFFDKQLYWVCLSAVVFLLACIPEYRFLRQRNIVVIAYLSIAVLLIFVFVFGAIVKGSQNRFDLGVFAVQPSDPAKFTLVLVLAKYFARRHVEIGHIRHILVSGAYAAVICVLVFLQPDFGGAIILASIWFGMVLVAGISWKHLGALLFTALVSVALLWQFVLQDYQKARIVSFIHPLADIRGAGYNAYQSTIAVGSGEWIGKGIGQGSQSKLRFLPEYQTDFIFAAYAEEWGFVGIMFLLGLYVVVITRILMLAAHGPDNFAILVSVGVAIMFISNFVVHVGMNMGLLPVTGTTIPLMSYGGSHMLTEFGALGILVGLCRRDRVLIHRRRADALESF